MKTCRIVTPPATDACGKPATHVIVWHDDDKTAACLACAVQMKQVALSEHKVQLVVERLA